MSDERLNDDQIAAIVGADKAREPGVWRVIPAHWSPDGHWSDILCDVPGIEGLVIGEMQNHRHTDMPKRFRMDNANAQFVALCSWAVPALLVEVIRLRSVNITERLAVFISWLEEQIHDAQAESRVPDEIRQRYCLARAEAYEYVLEVLRKTVGGDANDSRKGKD